MHSVESEGFLESMQAVNEARNGRDIEKIWLDPLHMPETRQKREGDCMNLQPGSKQAFATELQCANNHSQLMDAHISGMCAPSSDVQLESPDEKCKRQDWPREENLFQHEGKSQVLECTGTDDPGLAALCVPLAHSGHGLDSPSGDGPKISEIMTQRMPEDYLEEHWLAQKMKPTCGRDAIGNECLIGLPSICLQESPSGDVEASQLSPQLVWRCSSTRQSRQGTVLDYELLTVNSMLLVDLQEFNNLSGNSLLFFEYFRLMFTDWINQLHVCSYMRQYTVSRRFLLPPAWIPNSGS